jgi:hypothetical protein
MPLAHARGSEALILELRASSGCQKLGGTLGKNSAGTVEGYQDLIRGKAHGGKVRCCDTVGPHTFTVI